MNREYFWIKPQGEEVQIGVREHHSGLWFTCGNEQAAPEPVVVGARVQTSEAQSNRIEQLEAYIASLQSASIEDHKTIDWLRKLVFDSMQKLKALESPRTHFGGGFQIT